MTLGGQKTAVMGILNVTPDSFSDGGLWFRASDAIDRGRRMWQQGAQIIDVGGESTRPGAQRVGSEQEWMRVAPVVKALVSEGIPVSIDTVHAETASRALDAGAVLVNDVSGGRYDPEIVGVCAASDCAMVVQHWRGFPSDPALNTSYGDVVQDVISETLHQVRDVVEKGLPPERVVIDPGLGFGLRNQDSWTIVNSLADFVALGFPVLVGASRKRFVAERYGLEVEAGTARVTELAATGGVWAVRVHDVVANVAAVA